MCAVHMNATCRFLAAINAPACVPKSVHVGACETENTSLSEINKQEGQLRFKNGPCAACCAGSSLRCSLQDLHNVCMQSR